MKLSLIQFLWLAVSFQMGFSAPSKAQLLEKRITIVLSNQKLENALKTIAAKADIRLVYNNRVWKNSGTVNMGFTDTKIKEVLDRVLQSSDITYEVISDQFIVLKLKTIPVKTTELITPDSNVGIEQPLADQGFVVSGIVVDENGDPMPGVTVRVKNGTQIGATNAKGAYAIGVSRPNSILEFTFLGYKTIQGTVNSGITLNIRMLPDPARLDEVHIIGYGTTTKRISTGSQGGLTAKEIEIQPTTNVLQALEGRIPGVFVTQTNGLPGAGINVQIRGVNSLTKSNRPLYVIDGVPYLSDPINTLSSSTSVLPSAEGDTNPMNTINPNDIESLEVLKDADATAIYGSRGANGVVLITTKKGKPGKTKFSVNASTGVSKVAHFVPMLEIDQYLALRRKAYTNGTTASSTPTNADAPDLVTWDQTANTNWQKTLLGNSARTTDLNANVSGGDVLTNFYLSGTYHKEGNVYPGGQGYQRGGAKFSLNHASADQRFSLALTATYSTDKNNISTTDLATYAYNLPPNYPIYNPDGSYYWTAAGLGNPLAYLNQTNDNRTSNLLSSLGLKYTILKGLDIKSTFGFSKTDMNQVTIRPLSSLSPVFSIPTSGSASYTYNYTNNYIIEPQITYSTKIWKGTVNALAGGTYQFRQSKQPYYVNATGFPSDDFLTNISSATNVSTSSSSQDYKYASLFGRLNYNIENKYIVNVNFRRDGSSRFGPNKKFGNFGSVGAAWVFSEESFIKDKLNWLSFGKLKGSYGLVGSDDIGNYLYLDTYSTNGYVYNGSTGLVPSRIPNSELAWEETKKLDLGFELGFLKDRVSLSGSYYRNRTGNQLLNFPLSPQTGFSSYQGNLPAIVQNSGVELGVTTTNIKNKSFSWTSSFNISKNSNKLLSFPDIAKTSYYTTYIVGNPIGSYYTYQFAGIDPATNRPSFTHYNADGTTSAVATPTFGLAAIGRGDRVYSGTSYPDFYGGLTNNITYKGFTLDFTFQFVKQKGRSLLPSSFYPPGFFANMAASVANDYLALGNPDFLVAGSTGGLNGRATFRAFSNYASTDAGIVDASFIRMKNASLSYNLPAKLLSKIGAQNVRVFVQGQNLFTITKYNGFDPESQGVATPPLRTIVSGLQFTF
ncbi:SusC/RagA family TonB-linked outer membrane protein [Mucilaginibacter lappiensis]|uniref:TonB-linked SusC/RagA family outer membrane protein n=1 Tax=Mucilaginibacter lappiensis TaxID=354630 RepID=A0A841JKM3_9SPHI|nr:SusC/RagA family TonB-linked outer membrane protein [Mucilaginibacter lappiensis]MBB6130822.1 TonB-linked SusC/RagA family outer membrane protein [Mucilaginibacter lappiensis]